MNKTPIIVGVIVLLIVIAGIVYFNARPEGEKMMDQGETMMRQGEEMMMEGEKMMEEGGTMVEKGQKMMGGEVSFSGTVLAGSASPLLEFNEADYQKALASDRLVTLYFYANWCPICRAEFPKMENVFNDLSGDNVVGFRVNYNDNETDNAERELARQFGVAYQHTKVFLKNGERVLKSPETWEENRYIEEINKLISS